MISNMPPLRCGDGNAFTQGTNVRHHFAQADIKALRLVLDQRAIALVKHNVAARKFAAVIEIPSRQTGPVARIFMLDPGVDRQPDSPPVLCRKGLPWR